MRADARRNRELLLDAAIELILERGAEPPLDAVAKRAAVGIGTLYRHFPDRQRLLEGVARHALESAAAAAETAMAETSDGREALRTYMHLAVERGVGVLNLVRPLLDRPDWSADRSRMTELLGTILQRAEEEGSLRADVQMADIVYPVIRFSRPLQLGLTREDERAAAHRQLDTYIRGLGSR